MPAFTAPKLSAFQLEEIIDKVVPMIAAPADHEYFKGVLFVMGENQSSAQFGAFIAKLLKTAAGE